MSDTIKSWGGKLLDWLGLANVPAALKALAGLKGAAGQIPEISTVDADGNVTGFAAVNKPSGDGVTVPTKVSELTNDAGYQTETQVNALIAAVPTFAKKVVSELPAVGEDNTLYLVPFAADDGQYLEYLYVNGSWEVIGNGVGSGENYTLPVATSETLGGVRLPPKTDAHTEQATVDKNGNVWVKPPMQFTSEAGGVEFTNHVGNLYSADNILTKAPTLGANVLEMLGGSGKFCIFRAKPDTSYVITFTSAASLGNVGQANALGICTQVPVASGGPVTNVNNFSSGGYGKYRIIKTNSNLYEDTTYLIWQAPTSSDLTDVAIYEGDSIDGYDSIAAYSDLNGMSTSDALLVRPRNLGTEVAKSLARADTAVQPEELRADFVPVSSTDKLVLAPAERGGNAFRQMCYLINSAKASADILRYQTKLGSYYAHCPSINVVGTTAYISAFQNAKNTTDVYTYPECSTELYLVDINTMTQLAQYTVAGHGMTVEDLTFAYGSGACQSVMIDDTTLRTVFVAKLQNSDGIDEWYQCYRDFDITTSTFGAIGLCQLLDTDGNAHPFSTANASLYIQALSDTSVNTNIVCQPAKIGDKWYVACGCQAQWPNMPILATDEGARAWIDFRYWATPVIMANTKDAEGNEIEAVADKADLYEMSLLPNADGTIIYAASRQTNSAEPTVMVMAVDASSGAVKASCAVPTVNGSRPALILQGTMLYVAHINTEARGAGSEITALNYSSLAIIGSAVSLPPMVYPAFSKIDSGYIVAYMVPYGLYVSKLRNIVSYTNTGVANVIGHMLELLDGG